MLITIILFLISIIGIILSILIKPTIKIKNFSFQTFWIIPFISAILLIVLKRIPLNEVLNSFKSSLSVNPLKILILFISLSLISISLDLLGFFSHLAEKTLKKFNKNQYSLFFALYILIALLTIFTSNDIVILTFTPFICYFAKNAKINPIPYLIMEFVNANTYSMLLPIGNPTNIYLSNYFNISFIDYIYHMALPTLFAGISSLLILLLLFNKDLKKPMGQVNLLQLKIKNKSLTIINLSILIITSILLIISNYINLEMWLICFVAAITLSVILLIYSIILKNKYVLLNVYKRLPYNLIPFLISMFIIVLALDYNGITLILANSISNITNNNYLTTLIYLIISTLSDNLINNIPMSVLFSSILNNMENLNHLSIYATIIGSNIGAYLTPIGALAGIMWINLLKKQEIHFSFFNFMFYGIILVPIVLVASYLGLILFI